MAKLLLLGAWRESRVIRRILRCHLLPLFWDKVEWMARMIRIIWGLLSLGLGAYTYHFGSETKAGLALWGVGYLLIWGKE